MTRIILLLLAALSIAAQQPTVGSDGLTPEQRGAKENADPSETRVPMGDYCKAKGVTIGPKETHAHACECTYSCTIDDKGNVTEHEGPTCMTYCHIGGRRCTCHVEDPTPCTKEGHGNARMDMDGNVLAVRR